MKKKIAAAAALFALFACFAACGGTEQTPPEGPPQELTVTLDKTAAEMYVGETFTLTAEVSIEGAEIAWSTSSRAVVSFVADGNTAVVTAEGVGTAEIRVRSDERLMAKCSITVTEAPQALAVRLPQDMLVLRPGAAATVRAVADSGLTGDIEWKSSDASVASVEFQGLLARVTALAEGECTVTVACGGEEDSFTLIVSSEG